MDIGVIRYNEENKQIYKSRNSIWIFEVFVHFLILRLSTKVEIQYGYLRFFSFSTTAASTKVEIQYGYLRKQNYYRSNCVSTKVEIQYGYLSEKGVIGSGKSTKVEIQYGYLRAKMF